MWQEKDNQLNKKYVFENYSDAVTFVQHVAKVAESLNHHPDKIEITWGSVEIWLQSHSDGNIVTTKDHELSDRIDALVAKNDDKDVSDAQEIRVAKLYTDGGSRGNPGPSAIGVVLLDMDDNVVKKDGKYIGITTNNQAEYQALKHGLDRSRELGVKELTVFMDSLLVVNQMKGLYKVKNVELQPIYKAAIEAVNAFDHVDFVHVPRELNKIADGIVNETLDAQ